MSLVTHMVRELSPTFIELKELFGKSFRVAPKTSQDPGSFPNIYRHSNRMLRQERSGLEFWSPHKFLGAILVLILTSFQTALSSTAALRQIEDLHISRPRRVLFREVLAIRYSLDKDPASSPEIQLALEKQTVLLADLDPQSIIQK